MRLDLVRDLLEARDDQFVLRTEMTVLERHLVAASGLGDRFDADRAQAMLMEEIARRRDDPLPGAYRLGRVAPEGT